MLGPAAIAVSAVLFGVSLVATHGAVGDVDPWTFLSARFLVAAAALTVVGRWLPRRRGERTMLEVWAGVACGLALVAGYVLQTFGLRTVPASVSAFLTYLLVAFVPLLGALTWRRRPAAGAVVGVALALAGAFLLTGGDLAIGSGEALTVLAAFAYAVQIVLVGEARRHDVVRLTAVQLWVVGLACLPPGLVRADGLSAEAWAAVGATGAATAAAFALQVWGQRAVEATRAALLLLLDPVAAAALALALGERLDRLQIVGAALILGAIAVSEVATSRASVGSPPT